MSDNKTKVPTLDEFLHMSPEEQAWRLYAEQNSWLGKYSGAAAAANSRRAEPIVATPAPLKFDEITSCDGWKQPPSASERESMQDDQGWK